MKKNDHYFPTTEWIKDDKEPCGWRRVTYEGNDAVDGETTDGVPMLGEDLDVGAGGDAEVI